MLEIRDLKAGYDGKQVVGISQFSLEDGEHCLILGKSGSGKTTLLYSVAHLLKPMSGEILLDGTNMAALKAKQADAFRGKNIGIIYQTLHMVCALSVLENVVLAQYAAGVSQSESAARELLDALGLGQWQDRLPGALSHGQQQRVAIARAAVNRPKLILGDEPTSALDDETCEQVMQLLLKAAKISGASIMIATHDQRIRKYFQKTITLGGAHE